MIAREPVFGVVLCLLAVLLAIALRDGYVEMVKRERARPPTVGERLPEGALRAGAREFDAYHQRIVIGQPQAVAVTPAGGDRTFELTAAVHNATGRVIKGLEVRGAVIGPEGRPVSERIAVIVPTQQTAIEPNEAIRARLLLDGAAPEAAQAGLRLEVTGVIFD